MRKFLILLLATGLGLPVFAAEPGTSIKWQGWSDQIFEQAKREHRLVLLDLGAGWCHWCHVMEEITYRDPEVIRLLGERYIAVHVDQDARPDLSNLYEDYGWPATIVFNTDGSEIVKRQGYIPPKPMASLLQAIIDDPSPGPSVRKDAPVEANPSGLLTAERREKLRQTLIEEYDVKNGGWGDVHKFIDPDIIEYCWSEADRGDADFAEKARKTLTEARALIDPAWGGIYQYSTDGDWAHPHFEKIMMFQAEDLRIYALAYARSGKREDLQSAVQIRGFLEKFLSSPDGAFYTSQDADLVPGEHSGEYFALSDEKRRAQGIPPVDKHIYARENGWAITGFAALYAATGDEAVLQRALKAAQWVMANRALPNGGYKHDEKDAAGPYLGDNIAMARAFLALYSVTADRAWLKHAEEGMRLIDSTFKDSVGYRTSATKSALEVKPQLDENLAVARTANLLQHYTGSAEFGHIAARAMAYVTAVGVAESRGFQVGGVLLAERELSTPPLHVTIVGPKSDAQARALFQAALALPAPYKRVEWLDRTEGPLPDKSVDYPTLERSAAFRCTATACSAPIFDVAKLRK